MGREGGATNRDKEARERDAVRYALEERSCGPERGRRDVPAAVVPDDDADRQVDGRDDRLAGDDGLGEVLGPAHLAGDVQEGRAAAVREDDGRDGAHCREKRGIAVEGLNVLVPLRGDEGAAVGQRAARRKREEDKGAMRTEPVWGAAAGRSWTATPMTIITMADMIDVSPIQPRIEILFRVWTLARKKVMTAACETTGRKRGVSRRNGEKGADVGERNVRWRPRPPCTGGGRRR